MVRFSWSFVRVAYQQRTGWAHLVARTQCETEFSMEALCQYGCGKMLSQEEDNRKKLLITEMSNINSGRAEEDFSKMLVGTL